MKMRYHEVNQITTNCSKFDLYLKLLWMPVEKNIGLARIFLWMKQWLPLKDNWAWNNTFHWNRYKGALKSGNAPIHRTAMFVICKFIKEDKMVVSQSTDLAFALCKNLVNHSLESITTYSVKIFSHLLNLLVICWEITHTCVEQFAPIAEAFQMVCRHKKLKWKPYERVNRNFITAETWPLQFGKTQR